MSTPVWKRVREREIDTEKWRSIATALDILASDYESKTGTPAIADITPYGIGILVETGGRTLLETLSPNDVAGLSPKAYEMLHQARAVGDCVKK